MLEGLLVISGVALLAWCALLVADASLYQRIARRSLELASRTGAPPLPPAPTATSTSTSLMPLRALDVRIGSPIAEMSIPRVDFSAVVLHGSDDQTLRRGPGHLENTALPGDTGNVVIAGHRDSFFRPLRDVQLGDDVFMETPQGRFQYQVTTMQVVRAGDLTVLEPTNEEVLTLITCYPFWVLGDAPDRFIIRASRVDSAPAVAAVASLPSLAPTTAPLLTEKEHAAADEPVVARTSKAADDETLVRQTIERFRLTYNARLVSRNDVRPGGPLTFRACDVIIDGDLAAAECGTASASADDGERRVWMLTLQRRSGGWEIREIVAAD
jgi:sortase A